MEYGKCRGIERGMGRRDFLKAATLLGATAAGAGMLAGCAPKSASEAQAQTAPAATSYGAIYYIVYVNVSNL